MSRIFIVALQS